MNGILLLPIKHCLLDCFLVVTDVWVFLSVMFLRLSLYLNLSVLHHFVILGSWKWGYYSEFIIFRLLLCIAKLYPGKFVPLAVNE